MLHSYEPSAAGFPDAHLRIMSIGITQSPFRSPRLPLKISLSYHRKEPASVNAGLSPAPHTHDSRQRRRIDASRSRAA